MTIHDKWRPRNPRRSLIFNNCTVKAAGVLFYHIENNKLQILICEKKVKLKHKKGIIIEEKKLQEEIIQCLENLELDEKYKIVWEDFGGKVDVRDKSVCDTAVRETLEESNNIFEEKYIRDEIAKVSYHDFVWNNNCCYGTFVIPIQKKIDPEVLGDKEVHDNLERIGKWVTYEEFLEYRKDKLHIRLKTKKLLDVLGKIAKYT